MGATLETLKHLQLLKRLDLQQLQLVDGRKEMETSRYSRKKHTHSKWTVNTTILKLHIQTQGMLLYEDVEERTTDPGTAVPVPSEGTFSRSQGRARDCSWSLPYCPASTPLRDPHSHTLSWAPAHQAFCQHWWGMPQLLAFPSICFSLWKMGGTGAPSPDDQTAHGIWCLYIRIATDYTHTFKTAVIRKWAMKCVSDGTLIICFIA